MKVTKKAAKGSAGSLSNIPIDKNTIELSVIVRSATAAIPKKGVHLRKPLDIKEDENNPISPFPSMFGPSIDEDIMSSRVPMKTPVNMPFVSPYLIPA